MASWPSVAATIVSSGMEPDNDGTPWAKIRFAYRIDGVAYESSNLGYFFRWAYADRALVAKYPAGSRVTVYYDPEAPERSVLERQPSSLWLVLAGSGALAFGVAAFAS